MRKQDLLDLPNRKKTALRENWKLLLVLWEKSWEHPALQPPQSPTNTRVLPFVQGPNITDGRCYSGSLKEFWKSRLQSKWKHFILNPAELIWGTHTLVWHTSLPACTGWFGLEGAWGSSRSSTITEFQLPLGGVFPSAKTSPSCGSSMGLVVGVPQCQHCTETQPLLFTPQRQEPQSTET